MKTKLVIPRHVLTLMRWSAIEVFPAETVGFMLGGGPAESKVVSNVFPFQNITKRTKDEVIIDPKSDEHARDFFDDSLIGHYHSHPDEVPTLSKDITDPHTDFEEMEESDIEFIISLWLNKRGLWSFRHRAYVKIPAVTRDSRTHRRVEVEIV